MPAWLRVVLICVIGVALFLLGAVILLFWGLQGFRRLTPDDSEFFFIVMYLMLLVGGVFGIYYLARSFTVPLPRQTAWEQQA